VVWRLQPTHNDNWHFVSHKNWDTGEWRDIPIPDGHHTAPVAADITDLYFAPCLFSDARRVRRNAVPGRWLYADLDEVDPQTLPDTIIPTLAWETSPDRYQAMWLLDRALSPRSLEKLNQRLTYFTGADKGGWSLTKVLRIPGTVSTKYETPFQTHLVLNSKAVYPVHDVAALLKDVDLDLGLSAHSLERPAAQDLPDRALILKRRRKLIPIRARQLLNTKTIVRGDDRSARMWELENILLDAGLRPEEVLVLVRESAWNKYRSQRRELDMLWREIAKADANRARPARVDKPATRPLSPRDKSSRKNRTRESSNTLAPVSYRDFMTRALPRTSWLVEGIWSESAHGLLGGESKSFKTLIVLDLLVSVASGTPMLGRFPVPRKGPVLFIQEENDPGDVQDRLMRITHSRGVGPTLHKNGSTNPDHAEIDFGADLPIDVLSNTGFSLTDETDLIKLERYIRSTKPVLVALDPLYLLTPGIDEDSAVQMTPILQRLLRLKQKYHCGIMIVHHYKKATDKPSHRRAERMSGTGVFHRWLASGVYVERPDESKQIVRLSSEHRAQANLGAFSVEFDLGTDDDLHYEAIVEPWSTASRSASDSSREAQVDREHELTKLVTRLGRPVNVARLAERLELSPATVRRRANKAGLEIRNGRILLPSDDGSDSPS
jgi:hypothetical protein